MDMLERDVIFFILDISGYTRFIFSNEKEVAHSQIIIRELISTILEQVKLPLQIIRLEGDAVFLYAFRDDPEVPWKKTSRDLVYNLLTFFKVFTNKIAELTVHKICNCTACNHVEDLKLKAVVHSGKTAFFQIDGYQELTGKDVIIAHRLLKNSVTADEYVLMTEPAYNELVLPEGEVERGRETYDEIGTVETYIYYPPAYEPEIPSGSASPPAIFVETLRSEVSQEYAQVAQYPDLGFHFHTGRRLAKMLAYDEAWLGGLPEKAIESFAGTGNPFSLGTLKPGERVLDAGCGAGLDCFIAARKVGPGGEVIGVDMTGQMVEKAQKNALAVGVGNVFFKQGFIEELPVADGWADVVISNGAVNLAPDKDMVFSEFFRVLKPGGRLQIADILVQRPIPDSAKRRIELWAG
jgi:arsenite methyltransferase